MNNLSILKLKCFQCGNSFPVSEHQFDANAGIDCPYCHTAVDEQAVDDIKNAYLSVKGCNVELLNNHNQHKDPLFQISVESMEVNLNDGTEVQ